MDYKAAVITISDKGARGEREDTSGPSLCRILQAEGYDVVYTTIIPDEEEQIIRELKLCADEKKLSLILTTGGTGFSPRDITPEATLKVVERRTPGIPEVMRAESMKITPHGCLSREEAGIRGRSLIINLPGSEKASRENLSAVLKPIAHGLKMLNSQGSAECAAENGGAQQKKQKKERPSADAWLEEAKKEPSAEKIGMYLIHNGVVRKNAKAMVREGKETDDVTGMTFSYDKEKADRAIAAALQMDGIYYVRVWMNEGELEVGDDIMMVLIGGDIRPHVTACLNELVGELKTNCVSEREIF